MDGEYCGSPLNLVVPLILLAVLATLDERPTCSFIGSIKKLIHVPLATSNSPKTSAASHLIFIV